MILLKNVSKSYRNGVHALRDINLEVEDGEFVYIIGPTGCGKSTLIKILDGEELPDDGEVFVNGINVGKLRHAKVPLYRRNIGVIFQDFRLLPKMTVFENIAFALEVLAMEKPKLFRNNCPADNNKGQPSAEPLPIILRYSLRMSQPAILIQRNPLRSFNY